MRGEKGREKEREREREREWFIVKATDPYTKREGVEMEAGYAVTTRLSLAT